ncbi:meiotic recombination protein SPO11 [Odontomachus brunneus]|uniref:meiotic recombination protein SPO11 n=1 Tax=Odontomachus brunneus TaxID=486640 RepID=UPI0013F232E0|nr:meiotic recombination protein SPO11 [Odontomachus brunneus]
MWSTGNFIFSASDLSLSPELSKVSLPCSSQQDTVEYLSGMTASRNESLSESWRVCPVKAGRREKTSVSCTFDPSRKWFECETEDAAGSKAGGKYITGLDLKDLFVVEHEIEDAAKDEAESKTGLDFQDLFVVEHETESAVKSETESNVGFDLQDPFVVEKQMPKTGGKFRERTIAPISEKYLDVEEKCIDIPTVDNEAFREDLIARIEAVTLKIIEQIANGQSPCISYIGGRNSTTEFESQEETIYPGYSIDSQENTAYFSESPVDFAEQRDTRENANENSGRTTVNFAARRSRDKFVLMMMIMAETHCLLLTNTTKTKRSFYYDLKNPTTESLAPNQRYIDRALNNVANLLKCAPWDLRLLPTAKGLVAGNMSITLVDNEVIDCAISGGTLIPQIVSNVTSILAKAMFVLVIEKEAAFQKLLEENCPRALNCILVTGKGYPDVATRMFVKLLSDKMDLPVYIVVDADPFGVDIMLIYRFGSTALCKENEYLACPKARWLGIFPSELLTLGARTTPLTEADIAKLRSIEARAYVSEAVSKELSILRKGKAEIEAVSSLSKNFLTATYVPYKIDGRDYI